jgi:hypothetical protein
MLDSLLAGEYRFEKILAFTVEGIHSEQSGSGNQPWDSKVAEAVSGACGRARLPAPDSPGWYAVHLRWFVSLSPHRRDLDNLRLKPIVDELTRSGLWPDDSVCYVRAIYNEAAVVGDAREERVEVTVYRVSSAA